MTRRRTPSTIAGAALIAALLAVTTLFTATAHAAVLSDTCTSPISDGRAKPNLPQPVISTADIEWRVTYEVGAGTNAPITIRNLEINRGSGWSVESSYYWELRWGLRDKPASATKTGKLALLKTIVADGRQSPKLVAPDGGCTILLRPGLGGNASWPTVGIVGDSLTQSSFYVWAPPYTTAFNQGGYEFLNAAFPHGRMQFHLNSISLRAEVESLGGRTLANWADLATDPGLPVPNPIASEAQITKASRTMLDEFRGMAERSSTTRALVVALGANDVSKAYEVVYGGTALDRLYRLRVAERTVLRALAEISQADTCVVLVTPPTGRPFGITEWQDLSLRMGSLYREAAAGQRSADGVRATRLRVADFGLSSFFHHGSQTDPNNWFQPDDLHLNEAGVEAYALSIKEAVQRC